jgi:peptidoglycan L-alanyl-D-glutamate endopeptidase CwlK
MPFALGARSLARLEGVHPDLVKVVQLAIRKSDLDFAVLEGRRTVDRQRQLFGQGATKTMNSRHLTGHAVDLAPVINGDVSWDWPLYHRLAKTVKAAAAELGVPITWGGDWVRFRDGPHWELSWKAYPK